MPKLIEYFMLNEAGGTAQPTHRVDLDVPFEDMPQLIAAADVDDQFPGALQALPSWCRAAGQEGAFYADDGMLSWTPFIDGTPDYDNTLNWVGNAHWKRY